MAVTVKSVKDKQLPEIDDEFAQWRASSTPSRSSRATCASGSPRWKKVEQIYSARDEAAQAAGRRGRDPGPRGHRQGRGRGSQAGDDRPARADRRHPAGLLASEDKTEEQIDTELTEAAQEGVRIQAAARHHRRRRGHPGLGRRVRARDRAPGPARPDAAPAVLRPARPVGRGGRGLRRRTPWQALASVMEQVTMNDTAGNVLTLADCRPPARTSTPGTTTEQGIGRPPRTAHGAWRPMPFPGWGTCACAVSEHLPEREADAHRTG